MTPGTPDVSIVIPAFDEPEFLAEAVASVGDQRGVTFELIVVDDGSSRPLGPALTDLRPRIGRRLVYERQEHAGGAAARNRGVQLARAPWVSFLHHDDAWLPNKLARQLAATHEHPDAAFVYCAYERFGEGASRGRHPVAAPSGDILDALLEETWIRTLSAVMVRRDALGVEPWFDPAYRYASATDFTFRLAERHAALFVDATLVLKRSHPRRESRRDPLASHDESATIVERLQSRLRPAPGSERDHRIQRRLAQHRRKAAEAAYAIGDFHLSRRRYRESLRLRPSQLAAWRGWLAAWISERLPFAAGPPGGGDTRPG